MARHKKEYGVKAYGTWRYFESEARYRAYLMEWIMGTEGSERDRAVDALCALESGRPKYDSD